MVVLGLKLVVGGYILEIIIDFRRGRNDCTIFAAGMLMTFGKLGELWPIFCLLATGHQLRFKLIWIGVSWRVLV